MIYKFSESLLLQASGDFTTHCIAGGFVYVEAKKKLYDFWQKAELPEGYTQAKAEELAKAKAAKCEELNKICDSHLLSFESDALGDTHIYDSELEDQLNLLGLVNAGVDSFFRCLKKGESLKQNLPHSKAQLAKVYKDGLTYKSEMIYKCGLLKAQTMACESVEAVEKIVWKDE